MIHLRVIHLRMVHRVMPCILLIGRALVGRQMSHRAVVHLFRRLWGGFMGLLRAVRRVVLRGSGGGNERRTCKQSQAHQDRAPSGNGRTVTTCIMPACMW
jgi:hypothetical protein